MRYIKDITNDRFKIGIYQWNNKYIIKIESGMYEQTYKIDQYEISNIEEIDNVLDVVFLDSVARNFEVMDSNFADSLRRNEIIF